MFFVAPLNQKQDTTTAKLTKSNPLRVRTRGVTSWLDKHTLITTELKGKAGHCHISADFLWVKGLSPAHLY